MEPMYGSELERPITLHVTPEEFECIVYVMLFKTPEKWHEQHMTFLSEIVRVRNELKKAVEKEQGAWLERKNIAN